MGDILAVIVRKDAEIAQLEKELQWFRLELMARLDPSTGIREGMALPGGRLVWADGGAGVREPRPLDPGPDPLKESAVEPV